MTIGVGFLFAAILTSGLEATRLEAALEASLEPALEAEKPVSEAETTSASQSMLCGQPAAGFKNARLLTKTHVSLIIVAEAEGCNTNVVIKKVLMEDELPSLEKECEFSKMLTENNSTPPFNSTPPLALQCYHKYNKDSRFSVTFKNQDGEENVTSMDAAAIFEYFNGGELCTSRFDTETWNGCPIIYRADDQKKAMAAVWNQMILIVQLLRKHNIVHRDLHTQNILARANGPQIEIRIIDFATSYQWGNEPMLVAAKNNDFALNNMKYCLEVFGLDFCPAAWPPELRRFALDNKAELVPKDAAGNLRPFSYDLWSIGWDFLLMHLSVFCYPEGRQIAAVGPKGFEDQIFHIHMPSDQGVTEPKMYYKAHVVAQMAWGLAYTMGIRHEEWGPGKVFETLRRKVNEIPELLEDIVNKPDCLQPAQEPSELANLLHPDPALRTLTVS